jgi:hypothetical protein
LVITTRFLENLFPPLIFFIAVLVIALANIGCYIWYYLSINRLADIQKNPINVIYFKEIGCSIAIVLIACILQDWTCWNIEKSSDIITIEFIVSQIVLLSIMAVGLYTEIRACKILKKSEEYQNTSCIKGFELLKKSAYIFALNIIILPVYLLIFSVASIIVAFFIPQIFEITLKIGEIIGIIIVIITMYIIPFISLIFQYLGWQKIHNHHMEIVEYE